MTASSSGSLWPLCCRQRAAPGWCNVALPFVLLAGVVHLGNVWVLNRQPWRLSSTSPTAAISMLGTRDDKDLPEIVWLMSFPNSGTSYTIVNTEKLTGMTTATNYGVPEVHDDPPVPVRPDQIVSPYWHSNALQKPRRALTKTHCNTVLTYDEFELGCRTIAINNSSGHPQEYQYNASLVSAAIHLIRHPLDNIVSRKHHMLRKEVNTGILTAEQAHERFPDTAQGLAAWCDYKLSKTAGWQQFVPSSLDEIAENVSSVPCYGDLLYYIQWHNLAAKTLLLYQIPSFVLYYEDYASDYNATIRQLYQFVFYGGSNHSDSNNTMTTPLPLHWNHHVPFQDSKVYHDYFTPTQQEAVQKAVKALSTKYAWVLLQRYYNSSNVSTTKNNGDVVRS